MEVARRWDTLARNQGNDYESVAARNVQIACLHSIDTSGAVRLSEEVVADARRIGNPSLLSWVLMLHADSLAIDDPVASLPVYDEAIAMAARCGNAPGVATARAVRALTERSVKHDTAALPTYVDALDDLRRAGEHLTFPAVVVLVAGALVDLGLHEDAAVLFGAAQMNSASPLIIEERDRLVDVLPSALGEARFAELAARGARMRDDEIVDHARDVVERLRLAE